MMKICKKFLFLGFFLFGWWASASPAVRPQIFQDAAAGSAIMSLIEGSNKFVSAQLLSLDCDAATESYIQKLIEKARSGTQVRLLLNTAYSYTVRGCLDRLRSGGIEIQTAKTHSSYWVNDQDILLLGSENLVRMNLGPTPERDLMIEVSGPPAQAARKDFLREWQAESGRREDPAGVVMPESLQNLQGPQNAPPGAPESSEGAASPCQFLVEGGALRRHEISYLLLSKIKDAKQNIFLSTVRIEAEEGLSRKILDSLNFSAASVQILANGPRGADGELTSVLNEKEDQWRAGGFTFLANLLRWLRDWDGERVWSRNEKSYSRIVQSSKLSIRLYPEFIHYKVWAFDDAGLMLTSANLTAESFGNFHESAIYCENENRPLEWKGIQVRDIGRSSHFE